MQHYDNIDHICWYMYIRPYTLYCYTSEVFLLEVGGACGFRNPSSFCWGAVCGCWEVLDDLLLFKTMTASLCFLLWRWVVHSSSFFIWMPQTRQLSWLRELYLQYTMYSRLHRQLVSCPDPPFTQRWMYCITGQCVETLERKGLGTRLLDNMMCTEYNCPSRPKFLFLSLALLIV